MFSAKTGSCFIPLACAPAFILWFLTCSLVIGSLLGFTIISGLNNTWALLILFFKFPVSSSLFKLSGTKYPWIVKPKLVFTILLSPCWISVVLLYVSILALN